jgi:hypothetical protein
VRAVGHDDEPHGENDTAIPGRRAAIGVALFRRGRWKLSRV